MALVGIDVNETVEYVSELDKDKENPTKFLIGNLKNEDKLKLFADSIDASGKPDIGKIMANKPIPLIKAGLKGIRNLKDKKTGELKNYDVITDEVVDMIPFMAIPELLSKIIDSNFLGEEESKNS